MQQIELRSLGQVFDAPIDVIFSNTRIVQPDLLVVRDRAHELSPTANAICRWLSFAW